MTRSRKKHKERDSNIQLGADMMAAVIKKGHTPLFLISGKEIGAGYRDYSIACHKELPKDYLVYVLTRILKHLDGSIASETELN